MSNDSLRDPAGNDQLFLHYIKNQINWSLDYVPLIFRLTTQFFLDSQQLVIFTDSVRPAQGTGFNLPSPHSHHKIRNGGVFGLAGTVGNDRRETGIGRHLDGINGFG